MAIQGRLSRFPPPWGERVHPVRSWMFEQHCKRVNSFLNVCGEFLSSTIASNGVKVRVNHFHSPYAICYMPFRGGVQFAFPVSNGEAPLETWTSRQNTTRMWFEVRKVVDSIRGWHMIYGNASESTTLVRWCQRRVEVLLIWYTMNSAWISMMRELERSI